jgi:hypothetical protein
MNKSAQRLHRSLILFSAIILFSGCASVPKDAQTSIQSANALSVIKDEKHLRIEQYVDREATQTLTQLQLPRYRIPTNAYAEPITEKQATLVANQAARSLCRELAPYVNFTDQTSPETATLTVAINAIKPTGVGSAGMSSLLGFVVPGPFRLPAGLGALSADVEVRSASDQQIFITRWARGANAITNDARLSRIGDAWQIAGKIGDDVGKSLLDNDPNKSGVQREELSSEQIKANRSLCDTAFGNVNIAARGAGALLPLSPEAMDSGPPNANQKLAELELSIEPETMDSKQAAEETSVADPTK